MIIDKAHKFDRLKEATDKARFTYLKTPYSVPGCAFIMNQLQSMCTKRKVNPTLMAINFLMSESVFSLKNKNMQTKREKK